MEELLEILNEVNADVDFASCESLIDDGILDSFDIVSIVGELNDAFDVEISPVDIIPKNFNSAKAMWAMIERLQDN
ncbi:phosphopantetheine-binding protein [[Clostridium] fimetarium]|uniref:Phosphopantetheine attachment site n=1 Tax=[Clostridium] fimetarium TaxID=99656 RepID=A0A1I0R1I4_9FIRM|nr:phosphopantetheine-binding protein [[Clostridium] fimetarium]SEW34282.1 Phosphopantetheine attachment site [[Clostridium] fimetarium]